MILSGQSQHLEPEKKRRGLLGEDWEENKIFIGKADAPLMVCTRAEAQELIDSTFWQFYDIWENFHYGGFWPINPQDMDTDTVKTVLEMERYFQANFSQNHVILEYLKAILKARR